MGRRPRLWTSYGLLAATALWCHLLAIPLFALLTMGWGGVAAEFSAGSRVGEASFRGSERRSVPWRCPCLALAGHSPGGGPPGDPSRLDHPDLVRNLGSVFLYWFPFGRLSRPGEPTASGSRPAWGCHADRTGSGSGGELRRAARGRSPSRLRRPSPGSASRRLRDSPVSCGSPPGSRSLRSFTALATRCLRPAYGLRGLVGASLRGVKPHKVRSSRGLALSPWLLAAGWARSCWGWDEPRRGLAGSAQAVAAAAAEPAVCLSVGADPVFPPDPRSAAPTTD